MNELFTKEQRVEARAKIKEIEEQLATYRNINLVKFSERFERKQTMRKLNRIKSQLSKQINKSMEVQYRLYERPSPARII